MPPLAWPLCSGEVLAPAQRFPCSSSSLTARWEASREEVERPPLAHLSRDRLGHILTSHPRKPLSIGQPLTPCMAQGIWPTDGLKTPIESGVHCPLSTVHCPLSTVHCPLSTVHCPLSTVYCPLLIVHCPLFTFHCPLSNCPLSTVHCPGLGWVIVRMEQLPSWTGWMPWCSWTCWVLQEHTSIGELLSGALGWSRICPTTLSLFKM